MPGALADLALGYLEDQQEAMVQFLRRLVLLESPSSVPESQIPVFHMLEAKLRDLAYGTRQVSGEVSGGFLEAFPLKRPRHVPIQLLLGHCDTVWPLGTLNRMPVVIQDGAMRGPGTFDMKAGLTQMVFALQALRDLQLEPPLPPVLLINSDEEIGSRDSTPAIRRLAQIACRTFVMEPALGPTGKLKTARKGVGRFRVTVRSDSDLEHSPSMAILELSHVVQQLFDLNDVRRGVTVNVGTIDGGLRPDTSPGEGKAVVDVRVPDAASAQDIEMAIHGIQARTPGTTVQVEGRMRRPPLERTWRNRALWHHAQRIGQELGLSLDEGVAGGGSDGNTTSQFSATLDGLGAVGDGAHAVHEFVYLDKMVERTALLTLLLLTPTQVQQ
jgi:glutamate carboxypeptidase